MESKKLTLAMNILKYTVGVLGLIGCIWVIGTSPGSDATLEVKSDYAESTQMSFAIGFTIAVIFAAVAGVLLFFIYQLITNPKKTVMSIIGIVVAFVFFLILWMIGTSDTAASVGLEGNPDAGQGTLNWVTAGIYTIIIGVVVAGLLMTLGFWMRVFNSISRK